MNLFGVGVLELAVIFLIAFLVMGPGKTIENGAHGGQAAWRRAPHGERNHRRRRPDQRLEQRLERRWAANCPLNYGNHGSGRQAAGTAAHRRGAHQRARRRE